MSSGFSSIRRVHIQSGMFDSGADFDLFRSPGNNGVQHRVSILFGRNGSGKTTISQEIDRISVDGTCDSPFRDEAGESVSLTNKEKQSIRVFNEKYAQDTVLLREEGLETIVMLGTKAQAQKRIDEIDEELIEVGKSLPNGPSKR